MVAVFFAQKAFIVEGGRLLAVRRDSTDPNAPGQWEVPGGRLESGESLDEHLVREVFEETSLRVQPGAPFYIWKWNIRRSDPSDPETVVAVGRICTVIGGSLGTSRRMHDDYLGEMEWVPLEKLSCYNWIPNMLPVLESLATQLPDSAPRPSTAP